MSAGQTACRTASSQVSAVRADYIRKFVARAHGLGDLVDLGTLTAPAADFLDASVRAGLSVLVSGGTQAGKTTLDQWTAAPVHRTLVPHSTGRNLAHVCEED